VGETAADLGGGSGMGSCPASRAGDPEGRVIGIDIRDQQERVAACA
jgi:ubiquinone/menaquinone biosynthesis C-methylase UbiE